MSIYQNPEKYAEQTCISLELAQIRCEYFFKKEQETNDAKKCPKCGQMTLEYEGGSYEEGIQETIYCENDQIETVDEEGDVYYKECEFTSHVSKEFEPLLPYYDFDVVLMFSIQRKEEGIEEVEKQIGSSWEEFVEKDTNELVGENQKEVLK